MAQAAVTGKDTQIDCEGIEFHHADLRLSEGNLQGGEAEQEEEQYIPHAKTFPEKATRTVPKQEKGGAETRPSSIKSQNDRINRYWPMVFLTGTSIQSDWMTPQP